ncbi:MAG: 50S ribosomal protein L18 [Chloroflexota bacterium]
MRKARHRRVRRKVHGTQSRPRLSVFRSLKHTYAQIIDDSTGRTLVSMSTLHPSIRDGAGSKPKAREAEEVGRLLAERALGEGINSVTFDRGGYKYHGRVKALADAVRQAGLVF